MIRIRMFLISCFIILQGYIFAQSKEKQDPIDVKYKLCLDSIENQSTAGMCGCAYKALDDWDARLNKVYKALLIKLDSTQKPKLVEAQRQWIKFKEKEIVLIDETYGKAQGTMWLHMRADEIMSITRQRAQDLGFLLEMLKEME
jgi:uncharacterized protein YecT (DUF1311 family)